MRVIATYDKRASSAQAAISSRAGKPAVAEAAELQLDIVAVDDRPELVGHEVVLRAETGDDDDRELEALGGVDRQDADRVLVGLVGGDLRPLDRLHLVGDPGEVLDQGAPGLIEPGARLVDQVAHPPPGLAHHVRALELGGRGPHRPVVDLGEQGGGPAAVGVA